MKVATEILDFWFGSLDDNGFAEPGKAKLWFGGKAADALIAERFGKWVTYALASKLDAWADNAEGLMALVTLLDQFPRNIYRGSRRAFSGDARARDWANLAIANGIDRSMPPAWRLMLYMPLQHAENLSDQNLSVAMYELLLASTPEQCCERVTDSLRWARRHRDIVARYGRFPHRNAVMQRPSTEQERDWLAQGGDRFGQ
jgi:uncharacterized protein (DUF924 family)